MNRTAVFHSPSRVGFAIGGVPRLPALSAYQPYATPGATATALRRIVALRKDGEGWDTIGRSLSVHRKTAKALYDALPAHLK